MGLDRLGSSLEIQNVLVQTWMAATPPDSPIPYLPVVDSIRKEDLNYFVYKLPGCCL